MNLRLLLTHTLPIAALAGFALLQSGIASTELTPTLKYEARAGAGMSRRSFLARTGAWSTAVLLGLREQSEAHDRSPEHVDRLGQGKVDRKDKLPPEVLPVLAKEVESLGWNAAKDAPVRFFYIFSAEGPGNLAENSHTFASFVSVDEAGHQDWSTISWLPEDFAAVKKVKIFRTLFGAIGNMIHGNWTKADVGHNFGLLDQTLRWSLSPGKTLGVWGPYPITPEFMELGRARIQELRSGRIGYIADDHQTRASGVAVNCMHAVSDLRGNTRPTVGDDIAYGRWGVAGTQHVLKVFSAEGARLILEPVDVHQYRLFSTPSAPMAK